MGILRRTAGRALRDRPAFQQLRDVALDAAEAVLEARRDRLAEEAPRDPAGDVMAPQPTEAEIELVADRLERRVSEDPVLRSQNDLEPWWQNRIKIGGLITAVGSILQIVGVDVPQRWLDIVLQVGPDLGLVLGLGVAGIGQFASDRLAPVDWRRPWTLFGIGR